MVSVSDRRLQTLEPIICRSVLPGNWTMVDVRKTFYRIGYIDLTECTYKRQKTCKCMGKKIMKAALYTQIVFILNFMSF